MNRGSSVQFVPGATVLFIQRPEGGYFGGEPHWDPGGKPSVLSAVDTGQWNRFSSEVGQSVRRMQQEGKYCCIHAIVFVIGILLCLLPHLLRFTGVGRRLAPLDYELGMELGETFREHTGDGYVKYSTFDCIPHAYRRINTSSLTACKEACNANRECCGFGRHHEGEHLPFCELREGNLCNRCHEYAASDYYFKAEYEQFADFALLRSGSARATIRRMPDNENAGDDGDFDWTYYWLFPLLGIALILSGSGLFHWSRYSIIRENLKADECIAEACDNFSHAAGMQIEYLTMWTQFCRPRGTKSTRAISVTPSVPRAIGAPSRPVEPPVVQVARKHCLHCNALLVSSAHVCSNCGGSCKITPS